MRIYLMRHGETAWNAEKRLQGRTDIPLNESGRRLAQETASALQEVPFDLAITSPLKRARETAEIVLKGRKIPMIEEERIIEISFGIYEGMISSRANYEIPDPKFQNFFKAPQNYVPPQGGEDLYSLSTRTGAFMKELTAKEDYQDKTILISSHGGAVRGLLNSIKGCELKDYWGVGVPKNCSIAILESIQGETVILGENLVFYKERVL